MSVFRHLVLEIQWFFFVGFVVFVACSYLPGISVSRKNSPVRSINMPAVPSGKLKNLGSGRPPGASCATDVG